MVLWSGACIKSCWGLQRGKVGLAWRKTLASRTKRRHQQKWTTNAFQGGEGRENVVLPACKRTPAQPQPNPNSVLRDCTLARLANLDHTCFVYLITWSKGISVALFIWTNKGGKGFVTALFVDQSGDAEYLIHSSATVRRLHAFHVRTGTSNVYTTLILA
jgi:hypothetical protein